MKLKKQQISGVYVEHCIIPRPPITVDGAEVPQYHAFQFAAILDYDEFHKLCPEPEPSEKILPGGARSKNYEGEDYKKKMVEWTTKRFNWSFLKSISATPELEWETVKMDDPETWKLYTEELKKAGFSVAEMSRMGQAFQTANTLNEDKMEAARRHFFQNQKGQSNGQ